MAPCTTLNAGRILTRTFSDRRVAAFAHLSETLSAETQAALRQFSLERLMAYGVHYADAVELRARVWFGEPWQDVACELAETCLTPAELLLAEPSLASRANRLYRASALLRMSQMMMLSDNDERASIFSRAASLYSEAAQISGDREKVSIETVGGRLIGWIFPARGGPLIGSAVVIGGIEGWAMDFDALGPVLASRGVETLMLDGPGQGESRLLHQHYLTRSWEADYQGVFDFLSRRNDGAPLAFVGNSMGGSVAMHLAAREPRIVACCNNGGPRALGTRATNTSFFQKMAAHCGPIGEAEASVTWQTIRAADLDNPLRCPLLVIQGGMDPLVSTEDAKYVFDAARSTDKQMIIFSDGDHSVYNHSDDKHNVLGDWVASRLKTIAKADSVHAMSAAPRSENSC